MPVDIDLATNVKLIQDAYRTQNKDNKIIVVMLFYNPDEHVQTEHLHPDFTDMPDRYDFFNKGKMQIYKSMEELCDYAVKNYYKPDNGRVEEDIKDTISLYKNHPKEAKEMDEWSGVEWKGKESLFHINTKWPNLVTFYAHYDVNDFSPYPHLLFSTPQEATQFHLCAINLLGKVYGL